MEGIIAYFKGSDTKITRVLVFHHNGNFCEVTYMIRSAAIKAFRTTFKKITYFSLFQYRNKYNGELAA
jgi:hypothetical protein